MRKPLQRVNREWNALHNQQSAAYQAYDKPPEKLLQALSSCSASIGDYLNDHPQGLDSALQSFYFEVLQFCRVAELFDQQYLFDISKRDLDRKRNLSQLCLRNVVPAGFIGPRLSAARSTVLFSATLSPRHYYADLLGTPANTVCIDVESPFHADQLHVQIINQISTRFVHRQASLAPIVELIARQFMRRPGNYLAFFSSFDYLQQVAQLLAERYPGSIYGHSHGAWRRRNARRSSTGSPPKAKALALRCWAGRLAKASICRVHA